MAARLAIHMRGVDVIDDEARLHRLADRLGIDALVLDSVLLLMEEAEFVRVDRVHGHVHRVIERVPYYQDIYERFGEIWESRHPNEVESATINVLDDLVNGPRALESIAGAHGVQGSELELLLDVGRSGGYLARFTSPTDSSTVVYSPLYWEEKPEETLQLINKYGGQRIAKAIRSVRSFQGLPLPDLGPTASDDDRIIVDAMVAGLLPSPEVTSLKGAKRFAFTPYQGQVALSTTERAILQKARAVLACIRYGEHFGSITRVRDPAAILYALRSRGTIGPHTEIALQYGLLVVEGLARITRDVHRPSRYYLQIIDSSDNIRALDIASDMLAIGEAITERGLDSQARDILFNAGSLKDAQTTRSEEIARRLRRPSYSPELVMNEINMLIDDMRQP